MDNFNIFIVFPDDSSIGKSIDSREAFDAYLSNMKDLLDRADCEHNSNLFYQGSELSRFMNTLSELIFVEDYLIDEPSILIYELLKNSTDWTDQPFHKVADFYGIWDFHSRQVIQEISPSVKEAIEYAKEGKCLILHVQADFHPTKNSLFILKDTSTHTIQQFPVFFQLHQVHNLDSLEQWLQTARTPRQINSTDQRHNESSILYIKGKSPLLYDFRDPNAVNAVQKLLNEATGDAHENKDLMNYDPQKKTLYLV